LSVIDATMLRPLPYPDPEHLVEVYVEETQIVTLQSGEWAGAAERLRQTAYSIGPRVLVEEIRSAGALLATTIVTPRRRAVLLGLLGGLGLTPALGGVFRMTAYAVTPHTGDRVRIAFGARPDQVVQTIVRDAALPIACRTLVGAAGAALATRLIESFLCETAPGDPITLVVVAVTLAATESLAALVPALRAARVDPASSLRAE
jgi:hypothetical protein